MLWIMAVNKFNVLIDGICCSRVAVTALHSGRQQLYSLIWFRMKPPWLTCPDMLMQGICFVLRQYAYGIYLGIHTIAEGKVNDSILSSERDCRLSHTGGQGG
ncbi:hypothetical protein D3C75_923060 [compost metagenome]